MTNQSVTKLLNSKVKNLNSSIKKLDQLKVNVYIEAYTVELLYINRLSSDRKFAIKYPIFEIFMESSCPFFDYPDYLKYKLFVTDKKLTSIVKRISNSALDFIWNHIVVKATGEVKPEFKDRLAKLPKKGIVTRDHALNVYGDLKTRRVRRVGDDSKFREDPAYTKSELNGMTKNDLVIILLKLQKTNLKNKKKLEKLKDKDTKKPISQALIN
jgi:hypothetical protein